MIGSDSWINLPVGYNLVDHVNVRISERFRISAAFSRLLTSQTDTFITHPDVIFYDFYEAWTKPIASDQSAYLRELK